MNVAVLQPNVPERIKWDDHYGREILAKTFALNASATKESTDLVVWPETAVPLSFAKLWRSNGMRNLGRSRTLAVR